MIYMIYIYIWLMHLYRPPRRWYCRYLIAIWLIPGQQVPVSVIIMAHWVLTRTPVLINMILSTHEIYIGNACHRANVVFRESIMDTRAEQSSPSWVCIPETARDFCGIHTHGMTSVPHGRPWSILFLPRRFLFFFFFIAVMTSHKHQKSLKPSEIPL